jgi:hypothetical protein
VLAVVELLIERKRKKTREKKKQPHHLVFVARVGVIHCPLIFIVVIPASSCVVLMSLSLHCHLSPLHCRTCIIVCHPLPILIIICSVLPVVYWPFPVCVVMVLFVSSTSIAPYKQWLAGRVVVLCDMAPVMVQEQDMFPPCKQRLAAVV